MTVKPNSPSEGTDSDAKLPVPRNRDSEKSARQGRRKKKPRRLGSPPVHREGRHVEEASGYNSSDEREPRTNDQFSREKEEQFERRLRKERGFIIKKMIADGACLFRAVADQVYGNQDDHGQVRRSCMDYIDQNRDHFVGFLSGEEDFTQYVLRKREPHCYGNHIEIQAMSEIYNRSVEVYRYDPYPMSLYNCINGITDIPIRLSYHYEAHYNSVVDPNNPSIGLGLGFANFEPGRADRTLLDEVSKLSEMEAADESLLRDQICKSDLEATANALEQQIIHQSLLDQLGSRKVQESEDSSGRKRRRSSPLSYGGASDDDERPPKRPSPPLTNSYQTMSSLNQRSALMRIRKENLHMASYATSCHSGCATSSGRSSPPASWRPSPRPSPRHAASASGPVVRPKKRPEAGIPGPRATTPPATLAMSSHTVQQPPALASSAATGYTPMVVYPSARDTNHDAFVAAEIAATDLLVESPGGVSDMDEARILASVMAASSQQFFEECKARKGTGDPP